MHATKTLPSNYHHHDTLNLSNSRTMVWLNLAALPLLFLFGWFFSQVIIHIRNSNPFGGGFWSIVTAFSTWGLLGLILSVVIMLVFHELIHGLFFWLYTRQRPKFALRSGYAFAAAPDWFLPKFQYIGVGLSPLVFISLICILLAGFFPKPTIPYLLLIASFNAAGALGDMIVVAWVLRQPGNILVNDQGDLFSTYLPNAN